MLFFCNIKSDKEKKNKNYFLPPGVEPGFRDSKSHVLTAAPWKITLAYNYLIYNYNQ